MLWTLERLDDLLRQLRVRRGDSTLVEVKRAWGGAPSLGQTLCAFANMPEGGTIILGVDEASGFQITGVRDVAALEAAVAAQARTAVTPPVHVSFETLIAGRATVLIATVASLPLIDKPCRFQGRAYLRLADGDYPMSEQETWQLAALQERPRDDLVGVPDSALGSLDPTLTDALVAEVRRTSRRLRDQPDVAILEARRAIVESEATIAGLYALGTYPQKFEPRFSITASARDEGATDGVRMRDLAHFTGPVPDLVDDAVAWVARNTRSAVVVGGDGHVRDQPEIPPVAVRGFVTNALVHRDVSDLSHGKQVEIRLLPDRLVITNPGGLWGISREELGTPSGRSARNEYLYEICQSISTADGKRVVEGEGGGIREATAALSAAGLREPTLIDKGVSFTVIIWLPRPEPVVRYQQSVGSARGDASRWEAGPGQTADALECVGQPETARDATGGQMEAGRVDPRHMDTVVNEGPIVHALAEGPRSIVDLTYLTDLTRRQVKYSLDLLCHSGRVSVEGGQGRKNTVYRLAGPGYLP
ncbi:MAG: putative DNA binding domain-containing protein [Cellulomonadaceae bacterium]|nr:putative DNA binding domain-containing protein [Cellulomonadaceae bacterium]